MMDEAFEQMKADELKKSPEYLLRRKALLGTEKPKVKRLPLWLTAIRSRLGFK
jgi:hypothetical protein